MSGRTVKVRVAVAVGSNGHWNAVGFCCGDGQEAQALAGLQGEAPAGEGPTARVYWLSAELEVPPAFNPEVAATVETTTHDPAAAGAGG